MPVRERVPMKSLNGLTFSTTDISCTVYVKGIPRSTLVAVNLRSYTLRFPTHKSKECQTLSWKTTHKYNCQKRDAVHEDDDTQSAREEKNLTAWLNAWTMPLCSTALAALDLANHGSDYLSNHWYVSLPSWAQNENNETLFIIKSLYRAEEDWTEDRRAKVHGSWPVSSVPLLQ